MDGIHDMGGKPGFGKVDKSSDTEVFHDHWEAVVFAMSRAGARAGAWRNTDRFRHAIERIHPRAYLEHGYYGRWLGGIETLLVEAGLVTQAQITERARRLGAGVNDLVAAQPKPVPDAADGEPAGISAQRALPVPPRFHVGDRVLTTTVIQEGHTRLPAYAREKEGLIVEHHDGWVFPDTNAHGRGEHPQHLYTVEFSSETLWGKAGFCVCIDLFEPYLEPVDV